MRRHALFTTLIIAMTMLASLGIRAGSVAAQPLNDDYANAFVISGPGYTDAGSTAEATESPDDPAIALGDSCGGGNTVWYSFTPLANIRVAIDTFGSSYDTTLGVYTGGPGAFSYIACNDDSSSLQSRVEFDAVAGVTYGVVVGTCCGAGNLYGSDYVINVSEPPPPFDLDLTLDQGSIDKPTGSATMAGTLTCSTAGWVDIYVQLVQRWGHNIARGEGSFSGPCDGVTPVSIQIWPAGSVAFKGGKASLTASANGCDGFTCDSAFIEEAVKL